MSTATNLLAKPPAKLKMIECKEILGCTEIQWHEIGAIVLLLWLELTYLASWNYKGIRVIVHFMDRHKIRRRSISSTPSNPPPKIIIMVTRERRSISLWTRKTHDNGKSKETDGAGETTTTSWDEVTWLRCYDGRFTITEWRACATVTEV